MPRYHAWISSVEIDRVLNARRCGREGRVLGRRVEALGLGRLGRARVAHQEAHAQGRDLTELFGHELPEPIEARARGFDELEIAARLELHRDQRSNAERRSPRGGIGRQLADHRRLREARHFGIESERRRELPVREVRPRHAHQRDRALHRRVGAPCVGDRDRAACARVSPSRVLKDAGDPIVLEAAIGRADAHR
jgi:hypothetical protein